MGRLCHHHPDSSRRRDRARPQQHHQLLGARPALPRHHHDVPALDRLQRRPGRRHPGRHVGHRHGEDHLHQRRPVHRTGRHADRDPDHPRHTRRHCRSHAERDLPRPGQPRLRRPEPRTRTGADHGRHARRRGLCDLGIYARQRRRDRTTALRLHHHPRARPAPQHGGRQRQHGATAADRPDPGAIPDHRPGRPDGSTSTVANAAGQRAHAAPERLYLGSPAIHRDAHQRRNHGRTTAPGRLSGRAGPQRQRGPPAGTESAQRSRLDRRRRLLPGNRRPGRSHPLPTDRHPDHQSAVLHRSRTKPVQRSRAPDRQRARLPDPTRHLCPDRRWAISPRGRFRHRDRGLARTTTIRDCSNRSSAS